MFNLVLIIQTVLQMEGIPVYLGDCDKPEMCTAPPEKLFGALKKALRLWQQYDKEDDYQLKIKHIAAKYFPHNKGCGAAQLLQMAVTLPRSCFPLEEMGDASWLGVISQEALMASGHPWVVCSILPPAKRRLVKQLTTSWTLV